MPVRCRLAVLLLGVWITFDLSTPLAPGAFRFDATASVEVVSAEDYSAAVASDAQELRAPLFEVSLVAGLHLPERPQGPVSSRPRFVHRGPLRDPGRDRAAPSRSSDPA
jgi:hypothetical protein